MPEVESGTCGPSDDAWCDEVEAAEEPETDDEPDEAETSEEGQRRPKRAPLMPADSGAYIAHLGLAAASAESPPTLQLAGLLSVPHLGAGRCWS